MGSDDNATTVMTLTVPSCPVAFKRVHGVLLEQGILLLVVGVRQVCAARTRMTTFSTRDVKRTLRGRERNGFLVRIYTPWLTDFHLG